MVRIRFVTFLVVLSSMTVAVLTVGQDESKATVYVYRPGKFIGKAL